MKNEKRPLFWKEFKADKGGILSCEIPVIKILGDNIPGTYATGNICVKSTKKLRMGID